MLAILLYPPLFSTCIENALCMSLSPCTWVTSLALRFQHKRAHLYEDNVLRALQNIHIYDLWEFEYELIKPL